MKKDNKLKEFAKFLFQKSRRKSTKDIFNDIYKLPPEQAIKYLNDKKKNIKIIGNWDTLTSAEYKKIFTVANVTNADLLQTILNHLIKSKKDGTALQEFKANLTKEMQKSGWLTADGKGELPPHRLTTIYKTNANVSYSNGRYDSMQETAEITGNVYWQYMQVDRVTKRDEHAIYANRVYPYDDPIWNTIYPPSAFNCDCWVVPLNSNDIQRLNLRVEDGSKYIIKNEKQSHPIQIASNYIPELAKYDINLKKIIEKNVIERDLGFDKYDYNKLNDKTTQNFKNEVEKVPNKIKEETKEDNIKNINRYLRKDKLPTTVNIKDIEKQHKDIQKYFKGSVVNQLLENTVLYYGESYINDTKLPTYIKNLLNNFKSIKFPAYLELSYDKKYAYSKIVFTTYKTEDLYNQEEYIKIFFEFYLKRGTKYLPKNVSNRTVLLDANSEFYAFDIIQRGNVYYIKLRN